MNFKFINYDKGSFPFDALFYDSFFKSHMAENFFKRYEHDISKTFIKFRADYVFRICDIAVLVDPQDSNVVYSFVAYRNTADGIVVYYGFTKPAFEDKGLFSFLLQNIGIDKDKVVFVSLPFDVSKKFKEYKYKYSRFMI